MYVNYYDRFVKKDFEYPILEYCFVETKKMHW